VSLTLPPLTRMRLCRELRFDVGRGGAGHKAVLFAVASRAHVEAYYVPEYGPYTGRKLSATTTWCSLETLGRDAGLRLSATRVVLAHLEELGLVSVERPPGLPPLITGNDERLSAMWEATRDRRTPPVSDGGTPPVNDRGDASDPTGERWGTPPVNGGHPTGQRRGPLPETTPEGDLLRGALKATPKGEKRITHPSGSLGGGVGDGAALVTSRATTPELDELLTWYADAFSKTRGGVLFPRPEKQARKIKNHNEAMAQALDVYGADLRGMLTKALADPVKYFPGALKKDTDLDRFRPERQAKHTNGASRHRTAAPGEHGWKPAGAGLA